MIDYQYIYNTYNDLPSLIKLAWAVSALLALTIIFLSMYLKVIRHSLRKKREINIKFKTEYESLLVKYLYSGDDSKKTTETQNSIIESLKESVKIDSKRKIIIAVLYDLMNEVSGEMSDSIQTF